MIDYPKEWFSTAEKQPDDGRPVYIMHGKDETPKICLGYYDHGIRRWYDPNHLVYRMLTNVIAWAEAQKNVEL